MKFAIYLSLISILLLPFISCKKPTATEGKAAITETAPAKKSGPVDYAKIKTDLDLTENQVTRIKRIEKKHKDSVRSLKKKKQWVGPKNRKTRRTTNVKRTRDLKKVLKDKFDLYNNAVK